MIRKYTTVIIIVFLLILNSCNASDRKTTIYIQAFDDCPNQKIEQLKTDLEKIIGNVVVNKSIALPYFALNDLKTRYRADKLIRFLAQNTPLNGVTLGVTTKDISTTKGKYADWGVMGLGYCPGKSCVISSYRLKGKNQQEKLFKVAIHELGHTQGLPHCPDKSCYMRDAEGKDHLNEEIHFCGKCKNHLIKRGWDLK